MEKGKKVGSSSSSASSFSELFGPKDSSKSSSTSTGLFDSIFGPPNTVPGRDHGTRYDCRSAYGNTKHGAPDQMTQKGNKATNEDYKNPSYGNGTTEPCYYNSSIYYGGREVYSPAPQNTSPNHVYKKDGEGTDQNDDRASRGNWWEGSLYY